MAAGCSAGDPSGSTAPIEAEGTELAFAHTVRTSASPEAIWARWIDVATWPHWDTELRRATLRDPLGLDARGRLVPRRVAEVWARRLGPRFRQQLPSVMEELARLVESEGGPA